MTYITSSMIHGTRSREWTIRTKFENSVIRCKTSSSKGRSRMLNAEKVFALDNTTIDKEANGFGILKWACFNKLSQPKRFESSTCAKGLIFGRQI
eukprot:CCRYP_000232-RA/>CCRYP_000232-RA protein AED:0.38 eAED:0.57 QI:0/0/0.5/1/0/0/2/93/94